MKLSDKYILRKVAGERLLVQRNSDSGSDRIIYMNETAADMLEQFIASNTAVQAAEKLLSCYDVELEQLIQDAEEALRCFVQAGILIEDRAEEER